MAMIASSSDIWRSFGGRLKRYIRKSVRHEADAEDVLQDVFARIQEGLPGVRETARLEAWIFQVTRFAIIDHLRSRAGKRRPHELTREVASPPETRNVSTIVASWITPFLDELSEEDRTALRVSSLEGGSQKALAEKLGLSASAARSRVQRARKRLKEVILRCCQIELDRRGNAISFTRRGGHCRTCSCD
jgi:RNA polymerase sigma-70 factor, ECF subfamily